MIMKNDLPPEATSDPFKPPEEPCEVGCIHCGSVYSSSEIVWRRNEDGEGFWCCPAEDCDGKGYGFDIFPTDGSMWCDDEYDEDEPQPEQDPEQ